MISNFHLSLLGVLGVLSFATIVSEILYKIKTQSKTLKNVKIIVKSWWIIVFVVAGSIALGKYALLALFFALSLLVNNEYLKQSRFGSDRRPALFIILGLVSICQHAALLLGHDFLFFALIPLLILLVVPLTIILTNSILNLPEAFGSMVGLMLLNYFLSYIPALAFTQKIPWSSEEHALEAVLILIFFTECNDVFQFLCGILLGKKKIVPHVSPNKTEMGFIGGIICTTLAVSFVAPLLLQITRSQGALLGFAISIFGIFGDLFFSSVKRHLGIKDFSQALPGHGGYIDRVDSLIFTAPIFFQLLVYLKGTP